MGRLVRALDRGHLFEARPDLAPLVHWRGHSETPIHRWYRYREGFSPNLIEALNLGGRILDPFCGCGSIMVGAAQRDLESIGIDVNPLAAFVARVKLRPLRTRELDEVQAFADRFTREIARTAPSPAPALRITDKVFEPTILDSLLRLKTLLVQIESDAARDFALLAWLAILEQVGSYFKEGNGIKYRNKKRLKHGYAMRTDGEWQAARFGEDQRAFVVDAFAVQLRKMLADETTRPAAAWKKQTVVDGDALDLHEIVGERPIDSVIFSPPYANRFDYFESMKVELWFGDFVQTYEDMARLRKNSLRSHLGADLKKAYLPTNGLEDLIAQMDTNASSWKMGVPDALRGYFDDMRAVLDGVHRVLAKSGQCCIVVGNSAYAGVIIPTDVLLARIGLQVGFERVRLLRVRHLTVAPQQRSLLGRLQRYMRETVVVLEK